MGVPQPCSPQHVKQGPVQPRELLATTHDYHPADMAAAELRVGRIMHVSHPAAHEDAQPHHQQVFHLDAWETTLEGKEDTGEGQDSARVSDGWTRTTLQTNLSPGGTLSLFYIYIHQSIMQLLLQVGHLKFPKSGEIRAQGCVELDAAHPHSRELQLRVPALLPPQGQSLLPSGTPGAARGSAPAQGDPSQQIPPPLTKPHGHGRLPLPAPSTCAGPRTHG